MSDMTSHLYGTFCWVELATTDTADAQRFYGALMGWEFTHLTAEKLMCEGRPPGMAPDRIVYTECTLNGSRVCGLGETMSPEMPACWTLYINVTDADATVSKAAELGGGSPTGVHEFPGSRRMAFIADPQGGMVGVWQALQHSGLEVIMQPGTFLWAEHATRDTQAAGTFYGSLFDWDIDTDEDNESYSLFIPQSDPKRNYTAGMRILSDEFEPNIPPYWGTYFQVEDCAASLQKVKDLGGTVLTDPITIKQGTFAVVQDPQGVVFTIMKPTFM